MSVLLTALLGETLVGDALTLSQAARLIPAHRGEGRASPSCIWRWMRFGYRLPSGDVVKLEAARIGGRWLTTTAALMRFMESTTAASSPTSTDSTPSVCAPRSESRRRRASELAASRLKAAGA